MKPRFTQVQIIALSAKNILLHYLAHFHFTVDLPAISLFREENGDHATVVQVKLQGCAQ